MSLLPPIREKRINPIYKAGAVNINGCLSKIDMASRAGRLMSMGTSGVASSQPYFSAPLGVYSRSYTTCEIGEFAFRNRDYTDNEMLAVSDGLPPSFSSNIAVPVATTLNLLGDAVAPMQTEFTDADAREAIAQKLQILGVIVAGNRENNESNLTLMIDGVITVTNNGHKAIPPGWVIATVPSSKKIKDGGRGYPEESDGGRVTLQLEPYDPVIHKHTPQRAYACWKMLRSAGPEKTKDQYLTSYIILSTHLMNSVLGIAASALDTVAKDSGGSEELRRVLEEKMKKLSLNAMGSGDSLASKVIDNVFMAYGPNRHMLGKDASMDKLARAQAIGEYMYSVGEHVRTVLERVVGRALFGSVPGDDFDMILMQPSR